MRQSYEAGPPGRAEVTWLRTRHWPGCWRLLGRFYRDGKRAVAVATKLGELTEWKNPDALDTMAAAYAEAGQFDDAVKWEKKAMEQQRLLGPVRRSRPRRV